LPLSARRMIPETRQLLPRLPTVDRTEECCILDAREHRVQVRERRLEVPDACEFPGVLRAVVPLMRAGDAVVRELVADRLPRLPSIVGALDDLAMPTGGLRRVQPARIDRRSFQVVHLPPREQRALDIPIVTRTVRRQDERALSRTHEETHSAHRSLLLDLERPFSPMTSGGHRFRPRQWLDRVAKKKSSVTPPEAARERVRLECATHPESCDGGC